MSQDTQMLSDIAVKVGKLEALQESNTRAISDMANSVEKLVTKLDQSDDLAREAMQSTKSSHHRADELTKRVEGVEGDIKWLWRTAIGAIITGAIALLFKFKGGA
ncbi:hemolysin XhlA family protein [Paenibacillus aquistagni]|uniref:hemolysin XhlA family protein n=1 Tax=Paenibacillus aquistagni TaxID=1852522 RepID=UPI001F102D18|nr:hemolysin XhlA family protein [Paenibacillus aquistagni]